MESSILFGSTIFAGDYVSKAVFFGERTGQACQDCLENRSVGDELAWGQDLHSPQKNRFKMYIAPSGSS